MEPVEYPIDGVLDLHVFAPGEVGSLVPEYLHACQQEGILRVRIIHGKGKGVLRRRVHAILEELSDVYLYKLAGQDASNWGATIVWLKPSEQGRVRGE